MVRNRKRIIEFAAKTKLPAILPARKFVRRRRALELLREHC